MSKFEKDRNMAIRAARELFYPKEVVSDLLKCKTENEINRVMTNARCGHYSNNCTNCDNYANSETKTHKKFI